MLEDLLAQAGCTVIGPTGTIESVLTHIQQNAIDCAVLDVKLVDGKRFPIAGALSGRGVPLVFATAYQGHALGAGYAEGAEN